MSKCCLLLTNGADLWWICSLRRINVIYVVGWSSWTRECDHDDTADVDSDDEEDERIVFDSIDVLDVGSFDLGEIAFYPRKKEVSKMNF